MCCSSNVRLLSRPGSPSLTSPASRAILAGDDKWGLCSSGRRRSWMLSRGRRRPRPCREATIDNEQLGEEPAKRPASPLVGEAVEPALPARLMGGRRCRARSLQTCARVAPIRHGRANGRGRATFPHKGGRERSSLRPSLKLSLKARRQIHLSCPRFLTELVMRNLPNFLDNICLPIVKNLCRCAFCYGV